MPLFEFNLRPIQEILPWGESDDPNLHWFGLTDGYYYLNAKGHQLFRYTDDILSYWEDKNISFDKNIKHPDYQIVRLYEDTLDILPNVYQSIPDFIFDYIRDMGSFENLFSKINDFYKNEKDDEILDKFSLIGSFFGSRYLDSMHLTQGPNIWFMRNDDLIYVRWFNEDCILDNIQVWTELSGETMYPYADFVNEVLLFHQKLMSLMNERVSDVLDGKLNPRIRIDTDVLIKEQKEREHSLENALKKKCEFQEWETLERLLKEFERY